VDFGHYSDEAVRVATDLVNSLGSVTGNEYLGTAERARAFFSEHGLEPPAQISDKDVAEIHRVRNKLRAAFDAPDEAAAVKVLNRLLSAAGTRPRIADHDDGNWHIHYVSDRARPAQKLAAVAGMGLAMVVSEFGWDRVGVCSAEGCRDVFVDTSRNRSRRYCNDTCSTRTNVAAYRARRARE
jgi:predicted RNA-binding Zn ribbon-like protein